MCEFVFVVQMGHMCIKWLQDKEQSRRFTSQDSVQSNSHNSPMNQSSGIDRLVSRKILSSPSYIKTEQITHIYPVENDKAITEVVALNGFEMLEEIGKGSFAVVYKAKRLYDRQIVACKVMKMALTDWKHRANVKHELFILSRLKHPHIIEIYQHFIIRIDNNRMVYIFMQFAEQSLSIYVRKSKVGQPEAICKRMIAEIVNAVSYIHSKGIAHRDLKMGNVLLDKTLRCLITDFGLSRIVFCQSKLLSSNKFCGTMPYMAPEILLTRQYQVDYNPFQADIWAIGVILYCLINRAYPFQVDRLLEQQLCHVIKFTSRVTFTPGPELIDLQNKLLDPLSTKRITMNDLLKHPWFSKEQIIVQESVQKFRKFHITSEGNVKSSQSLNIDLGTYSCESLVSQKISQQQQTKKDKKSVKTTNTTVTSIDTRNTTNTARTAKPTGRSFTTSTPVQTAKRKNKHTNNYKK